MRATRIAALLAMASVCFLSSPALAGQAAGPIYDAQAWYDENHDLVHTSELVLADIPRRTRSPRKPGPP